MTRIVLSLLLAALAAFAQMPGREEIARMERMLVDNPRDDNTRVSLLYYYFRMASGRSEDPGLAQVARLKHILYYVDNEPGTVPAAALLYYIAATGFNGSAPEHKQLYERWKRLAAERPTDWPIVRNAAWFLAIEHKAEAKELLRSTQARLPENKSVPVTLGLIYGMDMVGLDNLAGEVGALVRDPERQKLREDAHKALDAEQNVYTLAGAATELRVAPSLGRLMTPFAGMEEYTAELERRAGVEAMRVAAAEYDEAVRQSSVTRGYMRPPARLAR